MEYVETWEEVQEQVSMESGLVGRNNRGPELTLSASRPGLNGVRPSWPEQSAGGPAARRPGQRVSMESGLVGRNNCVLIHFTRTPVSSLNGVRPSWPEQ